MIGSAVNYLKNFDNRFDYCYKVNDATHLSEKVPLSLELSYTFNRLEKIGNILLTPLGRSVQWLSSPTTGKLWKVAAVIIGIAGIVFAIFGVPLKAIGERLNPLGSKYAVARHLEHQVQKWNAQGQKVTAHIQSFPHALKDTDLLDEECQRDSLAGLRMNIFTQLNCIYKPGVFDFGEIKVGDSEELVQFKNHLAKIRTVWKEMCRVYAEDPKSFNTISYTDLAVACGQGVHQTLLLDTIMRSVMSSNVQLTVLTNGLKSNRTELVNAAQQFNVHILHKLWS